MCMMPRTVPSASVYAHGAGVRRCSFSGSPKNTVMGKVKSEPKYLACEESPIYTCFLLLNSSSSVVLLTSMVDWLLASFFFFSESPAVGFFQHSFTHLILQSMYIVKGQPHYLSCPPSPRNIIPTSSCNAHIKWCLSSWARTWAQIDIPSVTSNWHS